MGSCQTYSVWVSIVFFILNSIDVSLSHIYIDLASVKSRAMCCCRTPPLCCTFNGYLCPVVLRVSALLVNIKEQIDNSLSVWYLCSVILFPCSEKLIRHHTCSYKTLCGNFILIPYYLFKGVTNIHMSLCKIRKH